MLNNYFNWLLISPIWPVRLQNNVCNWTGQMEQFGPETAVNNQSCSSILLLTQLYDQYPAEIMFNFLFFSYGVTFCK